MTDKMLVRTPTGGWEELRPQADAPDAGIIEMFGEDIGPVLGSPAPVVVAAARPALPTGQPDAICLDAHGNITIVTFTQAAAEDPLAQLLSHAGALHGTSFEAFDKLCAHAQGDGGLAPFMKARSRHLDFHQGTFEVTVADALSHGRFQLVALVSSASPTLVQSMRYLNASGANVALYETRTYSSESVFAVQARALDVGQQAQQQQPMLSEMTAAGVLAITERTCDEVTAKLLGQLQKFCTASFDDVRYEGDSREAGMVATLTAGGTTVDLLTARTDGSVIVSFEALGEFDPSWTMRAELCQAMSRLLGAELGDVRKISQLNLNIREHLMDATLVEALIEILADTLQAVRGDTAAASATREAVAAA